MKADAKVEVDLEAAEELLVTRADFLHALKHDVKPALGSAEDLLQVCKQIKLHYIMYTQQVPDKQSKIIQEILRHVVKSALGYAEDFRHAPA